MAQWKSGRRQQTLNAGSPCQERRDAMTRAQQRKHSGTQVVVLGLWSCRSMPRSNTASSLTALCKPAYYRGPKPDHVGSISLLVRVIDVCL